MIALQIFNLQRFVVTGWQFYVLMLLFLLLSAWVFLAFKEADGEKSVGAVVHDVMARFLPTNSRT